MNKVLLKKRLCFDKFYDKFFGIFCRTRNIVNRNEYTYCYCHCILSLYVDSLYLWILNWIKTLSLNKNIIRERAIVTLSLSLFLPLLPFFLSLSENQFNRFSGSSEEKMVNWRHKRLFL